MNKTTLPGYLVPIVCELPLQTECIAAMWLWKLLLPVLCVVGTCGNIVNLVVLSRKRLRAHPMTVYMIFLAVADITMLWSSFVRVIPLRMFGVDIRHGSTFGCIVQRWLLYTSATFSIWILSLMTIERTFVTVLPVYARGKISRKMTLIACITLLIAIVLSTGFLLYAFELKTFPNRTHFTNETVTSPKTLMPVKELYVCLPRTDAIGAFLNGNWRVIVFIAYSLAPWIIILIGNTAIAVKLVFRRRARAMMVHPTTEGSSTVDKKRVASAKMLLVLCSFLFVTSVPYTSFGVIKSRYYSDVTDIKTNARLQLAYAVLHLLLYCNYTFNFLLYFVCSAMFQTEW